MVQGSSIVQCCFVVLAICVCTSKRTCIGPSSCVALSFESHTAAALRHQALRGSADSGLGRARGFPLGLAHDFHDDGALQQWWSIQHTYCAELQRLQRRMQRTLDQIRDPRTPTAVLEQLRDRIQAIALDMSSARAATWVRVHPERPRGLPTSPYVSPANARRRRPQRRKRRSDKRPCSSTTEESSPSADRVNSQRKRAQCYKEPTPPSSLIHISVQRTTSGPLFTVLLPTASGSKQTSSMNLASSRWQGSCSTPRAVGDTLESVSEKRKIQDLPRTTETGR